MTGLSISFRFEGESPDTVIKKFMAFDHYINDASGLWRKIAEDFARREGRLFDSEGTAGGAGPWAPWTPGYARSRPPGRILELTGKLKGSLTDPAQVIKGESAHALVLGTDVDYAKFHERGFYVKNRGHYTTKFAPKGHAIHKARAGAMAQRAVERARRQHTKQLAAKEHRLQSITHQMTEEMQRYSQRKARIEQLHAAGKINNQQALERARKNQALHDTRTRNFTRRLHRAEAVHIVPLESHMKNAFARAITRIPHRYAVRVWQPGSGMRFVEPRPPLISRSYSDAWRRLAVVWVHEQSLKAGFE